MARITVSGRVTPPPPKTYSGTVNFPSVGHISINEVKAWLKERRRIKSQTDNTKGSGGS